MKEEKNITKDIACAKLIISELKKKFHLKDVVGKNELLPEENRIFISDGIFNRAIRELARLDVLTRKGKGYIFNRDQIPNALNKLNSYDSQYVPLNEIERRLERKDILTRDEINNLLPELSIQQIDYVIQQLQERGFISKYRGKKSRGMYVISSREDDIYIPDVIGKLFQVYDNITLCYNTALEYFDLSRYVSSRIVYISGNTSSDINSIFDKKIKEVELKNPEIGIIDINKDQARITDKERTIIDCIRFPKYALGWENVFHALNRVKELDEEKILYYLREFRAPTLTSKVGVILEHYSSELDISPRFLSNLSLYKSSNPFRLLRVIPGKLNKRWNIYIPENFFENA